MNPQPFKVFQPKKLMDEINQHPTDVPRCKVCGWPLADSVDRGCVEGNCSMRPVPTAVSSSPLKPLSKDVGEAMWRVCEPNRPLPDAQPTAATAAPATADEVQALRDALAKATPGEWFGLAVDASSLSGSHSACGTGYGLLHGPKRVTLNKSEAFLPQDAIAIALAHNLTPKLLARLDAAVYDAKVQSQRADATMVELEKIHRLLGRGDGHGSLHATADCVICGIVTLKERVAEAEAESARLQEALDAAEAEIARLKAGGCARDQRTTQHCADAVAAEAQAVEFAWDALAFAGVCVNSESGIYDDCANSSAESAAEYLAARGLLRKTGERIWQRVEGK